MTCDLRRRIGVALLALTSCACSSGEKQEKERVSWDATARMTAEAWLSGSVSTRFAVDTLETAARETKSAHYEPLKTAIEKQDASEVQKVLRR